MIFVLGIIAILLILASVFYEQAVSRMQNVYLFLHFASFMGLASVFYYILQDLSGLYVITLYPLFLPFISTLRAYEIKKQKLKEQEMRAM